MKKLFQFLFVLFLATALLCGCDKDEENTTKTPVITSFSATSEAGGNDNVPLGGIISFEFNVEMQSDDKLEKYHLEIHDEPASGLASDEYKIIDKDYSEDFNGLRNTHIHDHIPVAIDASTGDYHFHLTVTSQNGYTSTKEASLKIIDNPNAPEIKDFNIVSKNNGTSFKVGDILVVSFKASAKNGNTLKSYNLEIHNEPTSGKVEDEYKLIDEDFTNNFTEETATITKEISVKNLAPTGNYHLHLHVYDNKNNASAYADEITIN